VIFDRRTFDDLRHAPLDVGAKFVIARWSAAVANVEVDDAGVFADIDTPQDYDAALRLDGR
jgi:CTP:molybdopterin cytidylyltransferase MocA